MKNLVWNNDIQNAQETCEEEYIEEWGEKAEDGYFDEHLEEVYEKIETWLEDEVSNLDIDTSHQIILVGTLQRWNGPVSAYKLLTRNIGTSLRGSLSAFNGDNSFEIYVENGSLYISQLGHDNPTNPSIFEFRELNMDFDELEDDSTESLLANSKPLGKEVSEVYGWEVAA